MNASVRSLDGGEPVGASAWDGYVASAIAEQLAAAFAEGRRADIRLLPSAALYR
jgi:myo-inositol 2-dehydrogenase/D-chiro-inositol 1-dehydrogenase